MEEKFEKEILELGLSVRALNRLSEHGITKISEMKELSFDELIQYRNCGLRSAREIADKLKAKGIYI